MVFADARIVRDVAQCRHRADRQLAVRIDAVKRVDALERHDQLGVCCRRQLREDVRAACEQHRVRLVRQRGRGVVDGCAAWSGSAARASLGTSTNKAAARRSRGSAPARRGATATAARAEDLFRRDRHFVDAHAHGIGRHSRRRE
jgi:hypothetical protein